MDDLSRRGFIGAVAGLAATHALPAAEPEPVTFKGHIIGCDIPSGESFTMIYWLRKTGSDWFYSNDGRNWIHVAHELEFDADYVYGS